MLISTLKLVALLSRTQYLTIVPRTRINLRLPMDATFLYISKYLCVVICESMILILFKSQISESLHIYCDGKKFNYAIAMHAVVNLALLLLDYIYVVRE